MKLRKIRRKFISLILVVAMACTGYGISTLASTVQVNANSEITTETNKTENLITTQKETSQKEIKKLKVVKEIKSERTKNTNTYLMSDGSKKLEIFGSDIRYKEKGKWKEYNAEIRETNVDDKALLEKIDVDSEAYIYTNTQGKYKHYFAQTVNEDNPVIMTYDDYEIKFSPVEKTVIETKTDEVQKEEITQADLEKADVETTSTEETKEVIDTLSVEKLDDEKPLELTYTNESKSIEYEYISLNNGVKESVILNEKPDNNIFEFNYNVTGLIIEKDEDVNIINVLDEKTLEKVAHIYAPNIIDKSGIPSYDNIEYSIKLKSDGCYILKITVDKKYLEEASYPITIDPALVWMDSSSIQLRQTFKCGGATNSVIDSSKTFMISTLTGGYESQVYIRFPYLNEVLKGKKIELGYANITTYSLSGQPDINVYQVMEDWDYDTITWTTKPAIGDEILGSSTDNYVVDSMYTVWFTEWLKKIATGEIDNKYGFALYNDNTVPNTFVTSYGLEADEMSKRPLFVIQYTDPIESNASYDGSFQISSEYNTTNNVIDLVWEDLEEEYDRYEIYRRKDNGNSFEIVGATTNTNYAVDVDESEIVDLRVMAIKEGQNANIAIDDTNYLSNIVSYQKFTEEVPASEEETTELPDLELDVNLNNGISTADAIVEIEDTVTVTTYEQMIIDTDGDELEDGYEIWDFKTLWNTETADSTEENKVYDLDTDDDLLPDSYEVFTLGTDPAVANAQNENSDNDDWSNLVEMERGTDPHLTDSDFDTVKDSADAKPKETNNSTSQTVATEAPTYISIYDKTYTIEEDRVTCTYVENIYNGVVKSVDYDYNNEKLNKKIKYYYDSNNNQTAIIEQYYNTATQTICVTFSYDDDNNNILICDQSTKYTMTYNEDGEMTEIRIGQVVRNEDGTINESDDQSLCLRKYIKGNNIVEENNEEDIEVGDEISSIEDIEEFGNGQKIRTVTTEYKVAENDTTSKATKIEIFFNQDSNASYSTEYNSEGSIIKFYDNVTDSEQTIEYSYNYEDEKTIITREDGFTKCVEIEDNSETEENLENIKTTTTISYTFKDIKGNDTTYTSKAIDVENGNESSVELYNGDIVNYNYNERDKITVNNIYSNLYEKNVLTTTQKVNGVENLQYTIDTYADDKELKYVFDPAGNITEIILGKDIIYEYSYDAHGRITEQKDYLIHEGHKYDYDTTGNIHSDTKYPLNEIGEFILNEGVAKQSTYNTTRWPGRLSSYNQKNISYDNAGNPINYMGKMRFEWNRGRLLTDIYFLDENNTQEQMNSDVIYKYNENGLRVYKDTISKTITYEWDEERLIREIVTYKETGNKYDVWYLYDGLENIIGYEYSYINDYNEKSTVRIYFEKDYLGNVIGLLDSRGMEIATYAYDAWGNITKTICYEGYEIAYNLNNITYKSYYRDEETNFYYLMTRYYDPEICRFINADDIEFLGNSGTVLSYNLYTYCESNPVLYKDPRGQDKYAKWVYDIYEFNKMSKYNATQAIHSFTCGMVFYNNKYTKKIYDRAIDWWVKNGQHKKIKKYGQANKRNYDRFDNYILGFANYWTSVEGFDYKVNYIKAMLAKESSMGYDSNRNGTKDVMQSLDGSNPALYCMAKIKPKSSDVGYDKNEGIANGIPKNGFGRVKKLFNDNNKFIASRVKPKVSICFGIFWLGYKTELSKKKGDKKIEEGVMDYNRDDNKEYLEYVKEVNKKPSDWIYGRGYFKKEK